MRADVYLFEKGFYESREKARKAILDSRVFVNGKMVLKPSYEIATNDDVQIKKSEVTEYVGRGGIKLEYALEKFNINPEGFRAIDIGASTGGFTDCLLRRGAKMVYAVDIGHGQLHLSLVRDKRVKNLEGINARYLTSEIVDNELVPLAVSDLSFISQKLVIPAIKNVLAVGGIYTVLIKPQFEVGTSNLNKNGIVTSEKARLRSLNSVVEFAISVGYEVIGVCESPIKGGSGNIEYLAAFKLTDNI